MRHIAINLIHALFALLLLVFAYLQLNDPDPWVWISFYLMCAAVPLSLLFNLYDRRILWIAAGLCLLHLGTAAPGAFEYLAHHLGHESIIQDMSPERPYIEETREWIGAAIALALIIVSAMIGRKKLI